MLLNELQRQRAGTPEVEVPECRLGVALGSGGGCSSFRLAGKSLSAAAFGGARPGSATIIVKALVAEWLIEIGGRGGEGLMAWR
jgi:hypothetical protein